MAFGWQSVYDRKVEGVLALFLSDGWLTFDSTVTSPLPICILPIIIATKTILFTDLSSAIWSYDT
jgi:hypothetical protein